MSFFDTALRARSVVAESARLTEEVQSLENEVHYVMCTVRLPCDHPDYHSETMLADARHRLQAAQHHLDEVRREAQENSYVPRLQAGVLLLQAARGLILGKSV